MNTIARTIAHRLAAGATGRIDEEYIRYGLEVFLGAFFQISIILLLAWPLGIFRQTLAIVCAAALYRRFAGGAHCGAYYRCTIMGWFSFLGLSYICRFIDLTYYPYYFSITLLSCFLVIYLKAPVDTEEKPVSNPRHRSQLRIKSFLIVTAFLLLSLLAKANGLDLLAVGFLLGLLWQTFTMTPWGALYMHLWDRLLGGFTNQYVGKEGV
ncbi:accessory gene regulator ArgB-like protein [Syntrophomonas palmitatica]|uniref:accessory gene regulator ArgB-like protein n=1 Tax=Syntrophomonas palmitatica TaxID=402877 RepID=UPI0006D2707A|nr:accessory gene regulator B family protein [Syntrophomonas palmitatica]